MFKPFVSIAGYNLWDWQWFLNFICTFENKIIVSLLLNNFFMRNKQVSYMQKWLSCYFDNSLNNHSENIINSLEQILQKT